MVPGFLRMEVELPDLLRVRSRIVTVSLPLSLLVKAGHMTSPGARGRGHGWEEWYVHRKKDLMAATFGTTYHTRGK